MKILAEKIIDGKKHYLIDDEATYGEKRPGGFESQYSHGGFIIAEDGKPAFKNPYYVPIQGINKSDNTRTDLTPKNNTTTDELIQAAKQKAIQKAQDAKILADRKANAQKSDEANSKMSLLPGTTFIGSPGEWNFKKGKFESGWTRQNMADVVAATPDRFRLFPNDPHSFIDDYLNPGVMLGSMAKALGEAPLKAQQTKSNLPYITSIGTPLAFGAVEGLTEMLPKKVTPPVRSYVNGIQPVDNLATFAKSAEIADNTIQTKGMDIVKELRSPQGFKRLAQQFKEAQPNLTNEQVNYLTRTRLDEVQYAIENNKPKSLKEVIQTTPDLGDPLVNGTVLDDYMPLNNAHYSSFPTKSPILRRIPEDLFPKPEPTEKVLSTSAQYRLANRNNFTNPAYEPGTVTLGRGLETKSYVLDHEIGHALQRSGGTLPIDSELKRVIEASSLKDKIWNKFLSPELQGDRSYFLRGSGGQESYAFLREQRRKMLDEGTINSIYDEIKPSDLIKTRLKSLLNTTGKNYENGDRLIKFTPPWKYENIAKIMNKAPSKDEVIDIPYMTEVQREQSALEISKGNEWIKNWYEHPKILKRLEKNNSFLKEAGKYNKFNDPVFDITNGTQQYSELADELEREFLRRKGVSHAGVYSGADKKALVFSDAASPSSTAVHEGTHKLTDGNIGISKQYKSLLKKVVNKDDILSEVVKPSSFDDIIRNEAITKDAKYFSQPTEIHARLNQIRNHYRFNPETVVTDDMAKGIIKDIAQGKTPISKKFADFISSPEGLSKALNKMFGVAAPVGVGMSMNSLDKKEFGGKILDIKIIGKQKMYLIEE